MTAGPPISTAARMLGIAGLLPQLGALLLIATGVDRALGTLMAFAYAVVILSFLGGISWGFAMRSGADQPRLAVLTITPTLAAFVLVIARVSGLRADWALIAVGVLLILTLLLDRNFAERGVTPPGWMGLRIPLSLTLGGLTILAGCLAPATIAIVYSA